jgi:hypothetical protein
MALTFVRNRALAYTSAPTFQEYLATSPAWAMQLRQRASEVRLPSDTQTFLNEYPDVINFAALINEDTPDFCIVLPIWQRIAQSNPHFDLRVISDTTDPLLLGALFETEDPIAFLEEQDLPLLFLLDEEWRIQAQWGPHPQAAESYLENWFAQHADYDALAESDAPADLVAYQQLNEALFQQLRLWYHPSLTKQAVSEIQKILASLREEQAGEENIDEGDE